MISQVNWCAGMAWYDHQWNNLLWRILHQHESLDFVLTRPLDQGLLENFLVQSDSKMVMQTTQLQFTRASRKRFYENYTFLHQEAAYVRFWLEFRWITKLYSLMRNWRCWLKKHASGISSGSGNLCGWLFIKQCLTKHPCQFCTKELFSDNLNSSTQLLRFLKGYEEWKDQLCQLNYLCSANWTTRSGRFEYVIFRSIGL